MKLKSIIAGLILFSSGWAGAQTDSIFPDGPVTSGTGIGIGTKRGVTVYSDLVSTVSSNRDRLGTVETSVTQALVPETLGTVTGRGSYANAGVTLDTDERGSEVDGGVFDWGTTNALNLPVPYPADPGITAAQNHQWNFLNLGRYLDSETMVTPYTGSTFGDTSRYAPRLEHGYYRPGGSVWPAGLWRGMVNVVSDGVLNLYAQEIENSAVGTAIEMTTDSVGITGDTTVDGTLTASGIVTGPNGPLLAASVIFTSSPLVKEVFEGSLYLGFSGGTTTATLNDITNNGNNTGNSIVVGGITINGNVSGTGWASFSGAVSGASGSFTGAISAASAALTGAITAATGTFTGAVTAQRFFADDGSTPSWDGLSWNAAGVLAGRALVVWDDAHIQNSAYVIKNMIVGQGRSKIGTADGSIVFGHSGTQGVGWTAGSTVGIIDTAAGNVSVRSRNSTDTVSLGGTTASNGSLRTNDVHTTVTGELWKGSARVPAVNQILAGDGLSATVSGSTVTIAPNGMSTTIKYTDWDTAINYTATFQNGILVSIE